MVSRDGDGNGDGKGGSGVKGGPGACGIQYTYFTVECRV